MLPAWEQRRPQGAAAAAAALLAAALLPVLAEDGQGFSSASYYTPRLRCTCSPSRASTRSSRAPSSPRWSRRHTCTRCSAPGARADGGRPTRGLAGDIVGFFQANNYKIKDATDVITSSRACGMLFYVHMQEGAEAQVYC